MKLLTDIFSIRATESIAALGSATLSSVFSPTWWLMKNLLEPYINLDELVAHGLDPDTLFQLVFQFRELGATVLFGQILPGLLVCMAVSVAYLFISAWIGQKALRLVMNRCKSGASA